MAPSLFIGLALVVGAPQAKAPPSDWNPIEGSWTLESSLVGGQPDPGLARAPIDRIEIGGGRWRVVRGADRPEGTEIVLDPKKRPEELTFLVQEGGEEKPREVAGIYQVEADRLTVCYDLFGPRPQVFESPDGSSVRLMVLKRLKKKE